jgi:fused signal recognition particle receptor
MTQPWTIVTPWGPVRVELAIAAAVAALAIGALLMLALRRRRRGARPRTAAVVGDRRTPAAEPSSFDRLRRGLGKTRAGLLGRLSPLLGRGRLDAEALEEIETALLAADVGARMTARLVDGLTRNADEPAQAVLRREIAGVLTAAATARSADEQVAAKPYVVMVVGVNGVGKTTTIGKLGARYAARGKSVMLVAGDTFRAAAIEQLGVWAERSGATLIRQQHGSDPGAVAYDGMRAAIARGVDVVIVDTAGRLHTKSNLMDELRKVRRVIAREVPGAPHETLLVLDAVTGQNGLAQARAFLEHLAVDGIVLTKLDGTAKGGVVVAIAGELRIPIRYVGVGESVDDLRDFDADEFVAALFGAPSGSVSLDSAAD